MSVITEKAPTTPDVSTPREIHIGWQGHDGTWYGLCGHTKRNGKSHGNNVPAGSVVCTPCEFEAVERGWWFS